MLWLLALAAGDIPAGCSTTSSTALGWDVGCSDDADSSGQCAYYAPESVCHGASGKCVVPASCYVAPTPTPAPTPEPTNPPCLCLNGGTCPSNDGVCSCAAGFTGSQCETETDECAAADCGPGSCTDLVNAYSCSCPPAYSGANCETSVTVSTTGCACFEDPDDFTCACCAVDACQCGGIASDTCAVCTDTETCAATVRDKQLNDPTAVDDDILTSSGCPCFFDNTKDCACCKPGRCQCQASAETYNFASVDLSDKCVPCANDCNDQWIDRSLDGQWVIHYPEPNEGKYGEMVWTVDGEAVSAYYLSGLLPGVPDTVWEGTVTQAGKNTYTVTNIHEDDEWGNVASETVTVSADGLTLTVVSGGATDCAGQTPGIACAVIGTEGDGSFRKSIAGCPCWWDTSDLSCACCSEGGCGCGGEDDPLTVEDETDEKGKCVPCSKWKRCDPEPLAELVYSRTTFRCDSNHFGGNCGGATDEQPRVVDEEYLDYTESRNGCPTQGAPGVDGACCRKGGCQCAIAPLHYVSPNLCVPCDDAARCEKENVIATWKIGEWTDCNQPCVGSVNDVLTIGTQKRFVTCTDQWYNALPDADCEAEDRIDRYAGADDNTQFPTKDNTDVTDHWFGGEKPITEQQCNLDACGDYTCRKTADQELLSISPYMDYNDASLYGPHTTTENSADDTCPTFSTVCHFDSSRSDCARCLPGGCACSWEPVKHLCVSCDVGGSACVGSIPDGDIFFFWEQGQWSGCDKACTFNGNKGIQHRVVTCKGADGGEYADHRCIAAEMPPRTQDCNTHSCADEYTHTLTGCTCWFDLSDASCGCCKPGSDGSAGCQITTPESPDLVGCDHCPGAVAQTPKPTPAPTPLPTPEPTLSAEDDLGGQTTSDDPTRRLEEQHARLLQEETPECMMCVAGVAPELQNCNPGNAGRYLGHAECCGVWASALDECVAHCRVSTRTRKLAACDTLVIGKKDEDTCDTCLERQQAGSSTGSDCQQWKGLLQQCAGPCKDGHRNYAGCAAEEPEVETTAVASPEACRRCVFARSPDVADCLPDSSGDVFIAASAAEKCCGQWNGWLSACEDECPAPQAAKGDSCDLKGVVDSNLVEGRLGWTPAATCEECVSRISEGSQCLADPTQKTCCDSWESSWATTCRFKCGSEGLSHTKARLCIGAGEGAGDASSVAPVLALFAVLAA